MTRPLPGDETFKVVDRSIDQGAYIRLNMRQVHLPSGPWAICFRLCSLLSLMSLMSAGDKRDTIYPQDYFISPVRTTTRLAGTFAELRPNHFHGGIDIKGSVGTPLFAPADGYVARIKVQAGGYGKALYIAHPNGYITVYGHMDRFTDVIEAYVRSEQYAQESFAVDIKLGEGQFDFQQGDPIGTIGKRGHAYGPHLHFEIRDSRTQQPINPLAFGLKVADEVPPRMHELRLYRLDHKRQTLGQQTNELYGSRGQYHLKTDTLLADSPHVGIALKTYDHFTGVRNWNGPYRIALYVDDSLHFRFLAEKFSFDESRYLNAHIDYGDRLLNNSYFNRLYCMPGNRLEMYHHGPDAGVVHLMPNQPRHIRVEVMDYAGNRSTVSGWLKLSNDPTPSPTQIFNYILPWSEENKVETADMRLHLPKGTLYETLYFKYATSPDRSQDVYSSVFHLHDNTVPLHQRARLALLPVAHLPEQLRDKAYIAYCSGDSGVKNAGGKWNKAGYLQTRIWQLGDYSIMVDTVAPTVEPSSFRADLRGRKTFSFKIKDNIPVTGSGRSLRYRAEVDGRWILMEYDPKQDLIFHTFDGILEPGSHQLELTVTDALDNTTRLTREFVL